MSDNDHHSPSSSPGERAVGVLGALVVCAMLTVLVHQAVTWHGPPRLTTQITQVQRTDAGYAASVVVENTGGRTAEGVHVTGEITRENTVVDTASTTIGYVPPDSHREVALVFTTDPERPNVDLRVGIAGFTPM
ncbi:hypothetical protein [Promicromonospora iranensis]|uniref:Uncharacterized protein (TIGR02588 family) n=1 Tax=Promicromonospora iranensis TaxID=1105144 RepID=A0ABU2CHI6_9MICO|nr:hypothetical protein [Promicromonospora iranensis]MDR7380795.1 uncharacterized protein (TIGR02588 family) [Promicromonospora iranensis]